MNMDYYKTLGFEIAVVAAVTALSLMLAVRLVGSIDSVRKACVVGLVVGACIHLAFELLGGNMYYCSFGAACGRS